MTDSGVDANSKETSRRVVLGGAAVIGASAILAACGGNDTAGTNTAPGTTADSKKSSGSGNSKGTLAGQAIDVPVGGGVVVASAKVVIGQPKAGEFKAFSYFCTHKGCPVKTVSGDTVTCPCHGSQFSVLDGSVKHGPATAPLNPVKVTEDGGQLFVQS